MTPKRIPARFFESIPGKHLKASVEKFLQEYLMKTTNDLLQKSLLLFLDSILQEAVKKFLLKRQTKGFLGKPLKKSNKISRGISRWILEEISRDSLKELS